MNDDVIAMLQRSRVYSPYFAVVDDKAATELGVVADWVCARYPDGDRRFPKFEVRSNPDDPPDVVLVDGNEERHGFEVTELVDGRTIDAHIKQNSMGFREFTQEEFSALVLDRIRRKSGVFFKDSSCVSKRLLIYSDEVAIAYGECAKWLSALPPVAHSFFDEIWFIVPPDIQPPGHRQKDAPCRIFLILKT